jgi:hypothetical protein
VKGYDEERVTKRGKPGDTKGEKQQEGGKSVLL